MRRPEIGHGNFARMAKSPRSDAISVISMRKIRTAEWTGLALGVGLALAIAAHAVAIPAQRLGMPLRATARWSFFWFCLATYGGVLRELFGARFEPLASRARDFGLAFAGAQSIHIALAAWLLVASTQPFPRLPLIVFSIGVLCLSVLAVCSLSTKLAGHLGARNWKRVRTICVEYLAFAFVFEFSSRILTGNRANALHYLPLFVAALGGPVLRAVAWINRRVNAGKAVDPLPG
ncbi:MAG TPA: hypothetical protein VGV09_15245 [Steroidobacteraceae bacterium]|nr:hypothetical protein [Steroidobacteraceae bacterium]